MGWAAHMIKLSLLKPSVVHKRYLWRPMLPLQILYYNFYYMQLRYTLK